jgi:nitrogen regulatory protein PII
LDLKSFLVGEAIQNEYEEKLKAKEQECEKLKDIANRALDKLNKYLDKQVQLDQLKVENEELKKNYFTVIQQRNKAEKTLAEIKEVALSVTGYFPDGEIFAQPEIEQILQKISEVEDE